MAGVPKASGSRSVDQSISRSVDRDAPRCAVQVWETIKKGRHLTGSMLAVSAFGQTWQGAELKVEKSGAVPHRLVAAELCDVCSALFCLRVSFLFKLAMRVKKAAAFA